MHLFIGNIPYPLSQEHFREIVEQHVQTNDAWIELDEAGRNKGFGFAKCESCNEQQLEALNNIVIDSRQLRVAIADENSKYIENRGNKS